jgi:serine/threonine protein kinase
MKKINKKK